MFPRLLCSILKADLNPGIDWSEIRNDQVIPRESIPSPRLFTGTETLEQVLCQGGNSLILYARWQKSGTIRRIRFSQPLDGREMRITEFVPEPNPIYRLQLSPQAGTPLVCDMTFQFWFRLWKNEPTMDELGSGICFIDSTSRDSLVKLRSQLLGGDVPESLRNEEAMWEKMNSLPESERRSALAALVTQQLGELDRKFDEEYPDLGPMPDKLQPLNDHVQKQLDRIRRTAAENPVDPELAKMMQQFARDAHDRAS